MSKYKFLILITVIASTAIVIKITTINKSDVKEVSSEKTKKATRTIASILPQSPTKKPTTITTTSTSITPTNDQGNQIPEEISNSKVVLTKLESCYETDDCNFPNNDPREYGMAIGLAIQTELHSLYNKVENKNLTNDAISQLARHYLSTPDGHIKEEALLILTTQPTSEANLYSILNDILNYHDADLTDMAMNELARYKNSEYSATINDYLKKNLLTGSHFTSLTIAKSISLFLSDDNIKEYQKIAQRMGTQSQSAQFLLASIENYKRQR